MSEVQPKRYIIDKDGLPDDFPTHLHEPLFWEELGRLIASFGFLEETLSKAIFAFTATTSYNENKISDAYEKWLPQLERALSDPLGNLIDVYGKSVRNNQSSTISNLDELLADLRKASTYRNVFCHGSWRAPDENKASLPLFINKNNEKFDTLIDIEFLKKTRKHVVELVCEVINTVTHMGWQFPGSNGLGLPIVR